MPLTDRVLAGSDQLQVAWVHAPTVRAAWATWARCVISVAPVIHLHAIGDRAFMGLK